MKGGVRRDKTSMQRGAYIVGFGVPGGGGGGCEIVACETRHKILSVWRGICIYLSVFSCPCVNVLPFFKI